MIGTNLAVVQDRHDIAAIESIEDLTGGMGFAESSISWDVSPDSDVNLLPTKIYGDSKFKQKCIALFTEFQDVFSRTLTNTPANVTPMKLDIDVDKWEQPANQLPPRLVTEQKMEEIRRQVAIMLQHGVIRPSNEPYYSQAHLVPKPNNKWRFTIDFRNLNRCSRALGWPIPHTAAMLQRIGNKRARYFAKIDLTTGYNQFPLDENSKKFTAFKVDIGEYEWNRVVMGLSGAGSHFQQKMAIEVLNGLVNIICEVYLDDILTWGVTQEELLANIRTILIRLRAKGILVNPDKVEIGLEQLEYVGHLLDRDGLHMTEDKLNSIRNFPLPVLKRELKSFLGLANYFRDHVRNHSILAKPLQSILDGYSSKDRNHKIKWTDALKADYEGLKAAVSNCQKLYFLLDENGEVHLQTDASDYGIGGYLFQIKPDGTVHPIMFISKSLNPVECRWSTPEKEMYAIWYSFKKMEHLIRDIPFTLHTDHENLIRDRTSGSPKVLRWKLDIQQFDYTVLHIKGEDNVVADSFSRLCAKEDKEYCASLNIDECVTDYLTKDVKLGKRKRKPQEFLELAASTEITSIPSDIHSKIAAVHNSMSGHHGVERTLLKLVRMGEK
jgi:hypothetical protein